jgi:hypothetical protein
MPHSRNLAMRALVRWQASWIICGVASVTTFGLVAVDVVDVDVDVEQVGFDVAVVVSVDVEAS